MKDNLKGKEIGILIGYGENCTCYDCPVLYGGECLTTEENNAKARLTNSQE